MGMGNQIGYGIKPRPATYKTNTLPAMLPLWSCAVLFSEKWMVEETSLGTSDLEKNKW